MPATDPIRSARSTLPPRRLDIRPSRFALEVYRCLTEEFLALGPDDPLTPEVLARVNRLLLRGGRLLAHAPVWQRARPFPAGAELYLRARPVVIALMKLLDRADPLFDVPPRERYARHCARTGG